MSIDMNAVPVLARIEVERHAEHLLLEAERALTVTLSPPIDIELVADKFLSLSIVYDNLFQRYADSGLHGGLFVPTREILVHEGLPSGRKNFTIGHEVGHWILHRHLIQGSDPNQVSLLGMAVDTDPPAEVKPTL